MRERLLRAVTWMVTSLMIIVALYGVLLWLYGDSARAVRLWGIAAVFIVGDIVIRVLALRRRTRKSATQPAILRVTKVAGDARAGEYPSIAAAVLAARPGTTIVVNPGDYVESVQVDKTLNIVGAAQSNTKVVLDGDLWAEGILVSCIWKG